MRFVIAVCPPTGHVLSMSLDDSPSMTWSPLPCWVPGSPCTDRHPLELAPAAAAAHLASAAEIASPDRLADGSSSAVSPVSVASGRLYGDPGAVGPAITSAAGAL